MFNSMELVELIRDLTETRSDYAVSKLLGIRPQTICNWKTGRGAMSEEIALNAAYLLKLDPDYVLACITAERAKGTPIYQNWVSISNRLTPRDSRETAKIIRLAK